MDRKNEAGLAEIGESSRKQKIRHTLQITHIPQVNNTRLTQSQGYGRQQRSKLRNSFILGVPSIPENEDVQIDKSHDEVRSQGQNRSDVGSLDRTKYFSNGNIDRIFQQRPSIISNSISSLQSLQVQKEQYCCSSKWSSIEKKLILFVILLTAVIIVLLSVIAVLVKNDRSETKTEMRKVNWMEQKESYPYGVVKRFSDPRVCAVGLPDNLLSHTSKLILV